MKKLNINDLYNILNLIDNLECKLEQVEELSKDTEAYAAIGCARHFCDLSQTIKCINYTIELLKNK